MSRSHLHLKVSFFFVFTWASSLLRAVISLFIGSLFSDPELNPGFPGGVSGTYKDPEGYFVDEKEAETFDAQFPPKKKLKLQGQLA
ncbi:hypothetical protein CAFE_15450 [Caprobacter fermentans]|uniref:Uncharacterized protein n=1 Tax=Caproicibacter fermentans TaxID=2576756 RepID=A0A6N8HZE1_9FIRM|nr:hypothetical protein [Caproicibacter fermentans]